MQAPIQKIRNGRCRNTSRGFPMAGWDKPLGLSNIKYSYQFTRREKRDLPAGGLRGWTCLPLEVLLSQWRSSRPKIGDGEATFLRFLRLPTRGIFASMVWWEKSIALRDWPGRGLRAASAR